MHLPSFRFTRVLVPLATTVTLLGGLAHAGSMAPAAGAARIPISGGCHLQSPAGAVQHVIYVQFDNTHFLRDNPNVPSDLEQMPNLLHFITGNGTLLTNHHTPLIAHTATDILTALTGVYGDRHGVPISNSFRYFNPNGTTNPGVSFAYWTDPIFDPSTVTPTDTLFNMLTADGKNAPAPWVPYTRAGCDVGAAGVANTVLENIATDIPTVFGANSPEAAEVKANPTLATADFVGVGIHCAAADPLCNTPNARPDLLPDEPGGYTGFQGLFGHKYVASQISATTPLTATDGSVIKDVHGNAGFPGFDGMSASVSLGYVAAMQEHGVPVTYAYISDAHDNHTAGSAFGPGEAGYVAALKSYDQAFGAFFTRLALDGIDKSNSLFVFTADEGDHFVGGPASPAGCDGVNTPCTYSKIGEINANLAGLLATEQAVTTPFAVHSDSAPNIYVTGNPVATAPTTRAYARALGKLTAVNPITGATDAVTHYLADPLEMRLLHMVTADPSRTPTLTMFADSNYFLFAGAANCATACVQEQPAFAWNHGDVSPDINTTWLGLVGPGVEHLGAYGGSYTDHTDIRPTMLALLGLRDDYQHEGRVIPAVLAPNAYPNGFAARRRDLEVLGQLYEQLNVPVGSLGLSTLAADTRALESSSDATYTAIQTRIARILSLRDGIVAQLQPIVDWTGPSAFPGRNAEPDLANTATLSSQAQALLNLAGDLGR